MARSPYPHSDRDLLGRIARSAGNKAGYKQLVRELGLGGGRERRLLVEQLTRMVARGELRRVAEDLWAIPAPPSEAERPGSRPQRTDSADLRARPSQDAQERSGRERLASGRLELHRDGFGFVRPEASPKSKGVPTLKEDIFIPPNALHGAMHGDLVLVDEDPPGRDGRRSGRVARVLTRRHPTVVGVFHYARPHGGRRGRYSAADEAFGLGGPRGNFVQPWDERMGGPIEIPAGAELLQSAAASPHRTLGEEALRAQAAKPTSRAAHKRLSPEDDQTVDRAEAKDARASPDPASPDPRWPLEGLAVEVEITSFPQPGRLAQGRVLEVLGPPDAFGVDVEIIIRKHGIPHTFPAHVLAEADERVALTVASLPSEEHAHREDFRGLPVVTIDGETARDFDDAVLVRPLRDGNTELQVHIADVGWYVSAGAALDTEARVRGTSVYFPDRAVPMLPHALSSGMCSLLPKEDRLALSCVMQIDEAGEVVGYRVAESIIRSARRMTYTGVQHCLNASPAAAGWNEHKAITPEPTAEDRLERERIALESPELVEGFDRMLELALRLNQKRVRRGSIDFDLPEPIVQFDPDGNMKAIVRSERGWAHRLIEEFMLSANECVATWLAGQSIPSIYRIHEMPDPKRIVEFEETAAAFGQTLGIGALPVRRLTMKSDRRETQRRAAEGRGSRAPQAHEIPERIPVTPQMYQRLVRRIAGKPEERILAYLMLRSLKQARYAEKNEGHFALASPCYTHFTSPIRRYPDLMVHRLLRTMLRRGANPHGGSITSRDAQPWATELARSQGKHAANMGDAAPAAKQVSAVSNPAVRASFRRSEGANRGSQRFGRVGWSDEGADGAGALRSHSASAPSQVDGEPHASGLPGGSLPGSEAHVRAFAEPMAAEELADIAVESSQAERRAAEAERELIEWKKMKFMADRIGDDFTAIILSVTKYGFFVELDDLFIEGLVPLGSLAGDHYAFRDTDRTICGSRIEHCFRVGDHVEVILDRIDRQQRRLQFALTPGTEPQPKAGAGSLRAGKSEAKKARAEARQLANAADKKTSQSKTKSKGKTKPGKRRK